MKAIRNGLVGMLSAMMSAHVAAAAPEFEVGGVVEVEAVSAEDYADNTENDIVLATVELAVGVELNERVATYLTFLHEEDDTDFSLDEGTVVLALTDAVSLTAGRMYVPFGRFDSLMVSDPQTLEMGEASETALMLSMASGPVSASAYLFKGDVSESSTLNAGDNDETGAGLSVDYAVNDHVALGASYISSLADSDTLQGLESAGGSPGVVDGHVAGASVYLSAGMGPVTVLAEHVTALDEFTNGDLDGSVGRNEQPSASNLELGYALENGVNLAAAYQLTEESAFIGLPESVASVAVSYEVLPGTLLAAEYAQMSDYAAADGGSDETASAVTIKLAAEF